MHGLSEEERKMKPAQFRRAKLLDRQPIPVRSDIFLHGLPASTLEDLRRAIEQGLTPYDLGFTADGTIAILRFIKPEYRGTFPDEPNASPA